MHTLDAQGTVVFQKQLEHVKAKMFEVLYPELTYRRVFPIATDAHPGSDSITYHSFDESGEATILANNAKDLHRVDISGAETTKLVRNIGAAFGYSYFDILRAQKAGMPLEQRKANAARRAIERKMNSIAYLGDEEYNMTGLLSDADVPSGNAPNGSWSSSSEPDDILEDVLDAGNQVFVDSNGVEYPNRLLVTPASKALLDTVRLSSMTEQTLIKWLVENVAWLQSVNDIIVVPELIEAGNASADVMVAMTADPEKLEFEIPMDITPLETDKIQLEYVTPVVARCAGLNIYYPGSMFISEGV